MADPKPILSRWMALDVGSKTIGLAISDPMRVTVRPLLTLQRVNLDIDCQAILRLAAEHAVEKIILGKPLHLDGSRSDILDTIEQFARQLQNISPVTIDWMDERLSTKEAESLMAEAGLRLEERRRRRNEFAAAVILRRYLEETG